VMAENWHTRQAIGLACQLPDNAEDARAILREVQNLVDTWLHPAEACPAATSTRHARKP
jgi:hypothetical protein